MLNLEYTDYVINTYLAFKNLNIRELYMRNKNMGRKDHTYIKMLL